MHLKCNLLEAAGILVTRRKGKMEFCIVILQGFSWEMRTTAIYTWPTNARVAQFRVHLDEVIWSWTYLSRTKAEVSTCSFKNWQLGIGNAGNPLETCLCPICLQSLMCTSLTQIIAYFLRCTSILLFSFSCERKIVFFRLKYFFFAVTLFSAILFFGSFTISFSLSSLPVFSVIICGLSAAVKDAAFGFPEMICAKHMNNLTSAMQ